MTEPIDYTLILEEIRDLLTDIKDQGTYKPFEDMEEGLPHAQILYDGLYDYGIRSEEDPDTFETIEVQYIDPMLNVIDQSVNFALPALLVLNIVIVLVLVSKWLND